MWTYNYSDELYHHGVKGMKWGVRRYQNKDGSITPAGKKRNYKDQKYKKLKLTNKQKKAIKIGAAAAATVLVAYGGYKLAKSGKLNNLFSKKGDTTLDIDEASGFIKKKFKESIDSDLRKVNPNFNPFNRDYSMNCGNCSIAFELRRRGLDVTARKNPTGMKISHFGEFFSGLKSNSFIQMGNDIDTSKLPSDTIKRGNAVKDIISSSIQKQYDSENARGALFFPHEYGSHWINWVKDGDNVSFYDGQNSNYDMISDLFSHYKRHANSVSAELTSIRLDDLDVTPNIHNVVKDVIDKSTNSNFDTFVDKGYTFIKKWQP